MEEGVSDSLATEIAGALGFTQDAIPEAAKTIQSLYKCFIERDCTQVEINPLSETPDHKVLAMDAKLGFDDNASFRQEEVFSWRDPTQEDPQEAEAGKYGLNFIKLMVTLPTLSMVLVWPWLLWTLSNYTVVNQPTSWTVVVLLLQKPLKSF